MKKLVMIDLVIIILVELQANALIPASFHPSSLPVPLPLSFKLDNVQGSFYSFLEKNIESCLARLKYESAMPICIIKSYRYSLIKYKMHKADLVFQKALKGFIHCRKTHMDLYLCAHCLLEWYEMHIKGHWYVIYTQNPSVMFRFGK